MFIPEHFFTQSRVFGEIRKLTENLHNNMDLGEAVRKVINDYKEGKYNPPSVIQFDNTTENKKS